MVGTKLVYVYVAISCHIHPHSRYWYMINIHWLVRDAKQKHLHYISSCAADKCLAMPHQCHIEQGLQIAWGKATQDIRRSAQRDLTCVSNLPHFWGTQREAWWLKGSAEISGHFGSGGLWSRDGDLRKHGRSLGRPEIFQEPIFVLQLSHWKLRYVEILDSDTLRKMEIIGRMLGSSVGIFQTCL